MKKGYKGLIYQAMFMFFCTSAEKNFAKEFYLLPQITSRLNELEIKLHEKEAQKKVDIPTGVEMSKKKHRNSLKSQKSM